jgi:putative transposase
MPRTARAAPGGYCFHALNRGNRRAIVFHDLDDYAAFLRLIRRASARRPMRLLGYCLMPNHFHLVLWPYHDRDLSTWFAWLLTAHVRAYQKRYRTTGHVWQGRFKAFPIQEDDHLLTVLRYVERNPLRAGLVPRAEDWPWSSLPGRLQPPLWPFIDPGPIALPTAADWAAWVQSPQTEDELARLRLCVGRDRPFGTDAWVERTAPALGLENTLRPRGRPVKQAGQEDNQTEGPTLFR